MERAARAVRRRIVFGLVATSLLFWPLDGRLVVHAAGKKPKAWFDAKAAFVFPLGSGPLPSTREELADSLARGWKSHIHFPEGGGTVEATGGRYPALGALNINLGGGTVDEAADRKSETLHPSGKVERSIAVREFNLDAHPLIEDKARLDIEVRATDARFDLEHDDRHRPLLMMNDARAATLVFSASNADLERMVTASLTEAGAKYGVTVRKTTLKINVLDDRAIDLDMHLSTRVAFIPAGMRFQAHVDIDEEMNARLSHLKIDGDEALGPLIVNFLRPGLAKLEGKTRVLFNFPSGQLKIRDVKLQGGDDVKIIAIFRR